jgi:Type I phosphodiesterase / nucleotide pyrophosphatase
MTDLSETLLPRLLARRLPGLPALPPDFVMPDYDGGSIANLPSQVAAWLGAGPFGNGGLHPEWVSVLEGPVTRVVMVLVDALGYERFRSLLAEPGSGWDWLQRRGVLAPLTSVFPSTTTAALTSLSTGVPPGRHGMLGYEMWLKEFGVTANMIQLQPMAAGHVTGSLAEVGLDQDTFTRSPILAQHLAAQGVDVHAFLPAFIVGSGLTRMNLGRVARHPIHTPADLWPGIRQLLEATPGARQLVWAYWPMVDTLSHQYGPSAEAVTREARSFGDMLRQAFLEPLPAAARAGTLFVLLADHGQVDTPPVPDFNLKNHPEFVDLLHILPNGENRAAYLHCRPGQVDAARAYIEQHWPDQFVVVSQEAVMRSGLLGSELDDRTPARLGELLVLARDDAYLWWAANENRMLGRHGSLTRDEMLVPLLAARLDS